LCGGLLFASNLPIKGTGSTANITTSVVIGTDGNGNYTINVGPSAGGAGNPISITVQLPGLEPGSAFKTDKTSNGDISLSGGVATFTFKSTGGSRISPGKFQVTSTIPGKLFTPLKGSAIIKVTYAGGKTISGSDDSYEDPKAPPKKNRFSEAESISHSLAFDALTGLLTVDNDFLTSTSIPGDPSVGAAVHLVLNCITTFMY